MVGIPMSVVRFFSTGPYVALGGGHLFTAEEALWAIDEAVKGHPEVKAKDIQRMPRPYYEYLELETSLVKSNVKVEVPSHSLDGYWVLEAMVVQLPDFEEPHVAWQIRLDYDRILHDWEVAGCPLIWRPRQLG
jgi:hypothetical protein